MLGETQDTFCILPWVHLNVKPSGGLSVCSRAAHSQLKSKEGIEFRLGRHPLDVVHNSGNLNRIRRELNVGEYPKECQSCLKVEQRGGLSHRIVETQKWIQKIGIDEVQQMRQFSKENNGQVNQPLRSLDLRIGNTCNLKCRMCSAISSQLIYKENLELRREGLTLPFEITKANKRAEEIQEWFLDKRFWRDLMSEMPHLQRIYLSGGEPLVTPQIYRVMKLCVFKQQTSHIDLHVSTNGTVLPDKFIKLSESFRSVHLNFSVDGLNRVNSYIRFPSVWNDIESNMMRLFKMCTERFVLSFHVTVSIYNALEVTKLIDWLKSQSMGEAFPRIVLQPVHHPHFLSISTLPLKAKEEVIKSWSDWSLRPENQNFQDEINQLKELKSILNESDESPQTEIDKFINYTRILDYSRKQNFWSTLPEIAQFYPSFEK